MIKTLTSTLLISLFLISCNDSSKEKKEPDVYLEKEMNNYSDEFKELVEFHGQYMVILAIINIGMLQNKNSELTNIIQYWDYADYKENILQSINSNEVFDKALYYQVEILKKHGLLSEIVENWIEIYGFINHIRKMNFNISFEEFLYNISEMKPIMDNFFHENNIQEWSSMSYSQNYQFDYYVCNYLTNISEYERMKLIKIITSMSLIHLENTNKTLSL